jgi:ribosome maturation factor RimP
MYKEAIISELRDLVGNYLESQGLDLVDLIYRYEGRSLFLRILVDKPESGITLDECARLNNDISSILDEKDILTERYILEVSSPGLDRPLITKNDFLRCINKKVVFYLSESINGRIELKGIIAKVEDSSTYIDIEGKAIEIPLVKIKKAKQIVNMTGD